MDIVKARRYHTIKGALNQFENIYRLKKASVDAVMNRVVGRWTSNNAFEHYVLFDSIPMPHRWDRGMPRQRQAFDEYLLTIENLSFELTIPWHRYDEEDDQTQSIRSRIAQGAARFAYLEEKLFIEVLTGTASELNSIPNAWDGYSLFSTGGGTRFGLSGGNILSGSSGAYSTPHDFLQDVNEVIAMFIQMKDTVNEPLFTPPELQNPLVIVPPALRENALQARNSQLMGTPAGGGAMQSNVFKGTFDVWVNNRLTGYDWYVVLQNADTKPIAIQTRQGIRNQLFNETNSHDLADTNIREIMWDNRLMVFPYNPQTAIKVNN